MLDSKKNGKAILHTPLSPGDKECDEGEEKQEKWDWEALGIIKECCAIWVRNSVKFAKLGVERSQDDNLQLMKHKEKKSY